MEEDKQRKRLEIPVAKVLCFGLSFNNSSSQRVAETATEIADDNTPLETSTDVDDDDFEFTFVRSDSDFTNEISREEKIRQIFPVFGRDLHIFDRLDQSHDNEPDKSTLRLPFKNERDPVSTSSSEADELENIPEDMYCIWRPKIVEESAGIHKKSNSTGSPLRQWKLPKLLSLRRSHSERGKEDSFVFLTPNNREPKAEKQGRVETPKSEQMKAKGIAAVGQKLPPSLSSHEAFYLRNRSWRDGEKRKSFLPYRKDLVGFFPSVNAYGNTFPPF